jgi:hypothetical protein
MGARRIKKCGKYAPEWTGMSTADWMAKRAKYWQSQKDKKEKRKETRKRTAEAIK